MVWGDISQGRLSEVEQVLPFIRFPMMTQQELLVSTGLATCNKLVCFQQVACYHTVFLCEHSCCRQHASEWTRLLHLGNSCHFVVRRFRWSNCSKSCWQQRESCCPTVTVQSVHSNAVIGGCTYKRTPQQCNLRAPFLWSDCNHYVCRILSVLRN